MELKLNSTYHILKCFDNYKDQIIPDVRPFAHRQPSNLRRYLLDWPPALSLARKATDLLPSTLHYIQSMHVSL